jgi:guanylate kinase
MKPGLIIVVAGPAGVGKGSVVKRVRELSGNIVMSVSATTRPPRPGEEDGVNYFFKSREQFEEMIANDSLIEWVEYCGNYYGTPKDFILREKEKGNSIILEIDVVGSMKIRSMFPDCVMCFIAPPSFEELARRLRDRKTEDEETIRKRLQRAREEYGWISEFDYIIINDTIEQAAMDFLSIVRAEQMKTSRNAGLIKEIGSEP